MLVVVFLGSFSAGNLPSARAQGMATETPRATSLAAKYIFINMLERLFHDNGPDHIDPLAPGDFGKASPSNGSTMVPINTTLSWSASSEATSYEYCVDTINNNACDHAWSVVGNTTTINVSGLQSNTKYYWQVHSFTPPATPGTDANGGVWWSFTTAPAPGAFRKSHPANGATNVAYPTSLSWGGSSNATRYEYYITPWNWAYQSTGEDRSVNLGLGYSASYSWQVRAIGPGGVTYADNGESWTFTTGPEAPGIFNKSLPLPGTIVQAGTQTISWDDSPRAVSYSYCYHTSDDDTCIGSWHTTAGTSANISVSYETTYYWHVIAYNLAGFMTESNGGWWHFRTVRPPGAFDKKSPVNNTTGLSTSPTLSWGASSIAASYEYCYDTTNDSACNGPWLGNGTSTSITLSGLNPGDTYYWQVRVNTNIGTIYYANAGSWWQFTTAPIPAAFNKVAPVDTTTDLSLSPTLSWESSIGAASYEYCYDTTSDSACNETWNNTESNTSITLSGLTPNTTYYWQVRAYTINGTTYANTEEIWWSFTTAPLPGNFAKIDPTNTFTNVSVNPTLSWGSSSNAVSYEYCLDTSNNTSCNATWVSPGTNTSVPLSGLTPNTIYYWQVRANTNAGTLYSNEGTWWRFTTASLPDAFDKTSPVDGANYLPLSPVLSWEINTSAISYEYCYDTIYNYSCDGIWINVGINTSISLSGLTPNTTYYWQVRANGLGGTTDANSGIWWHFTTASLPSTFTKYTPLHRSINVSINPTLDWKTSHSTTSYEYCADVTNNYTCDGTWTNVETNNSVTLSGLTPNTTYYWQVRAIGPGGVTYADNGAWWLFTTAPQPGAFNKSFPWNNYPGLGHSGVSATWGNSSNTTGYEYCIDTTNDSTCDGTWNSAELNNSAILSGFTPNTTYYWQVRAIGPGGVTYADNGIWWFFTTAPPLPGAFNRINPANNRAGLPLSITLSWESSSNATNYEYCYDTTNDSACNETWNNTEANTSITLSGLIPNTTYYWQVRANSPGGTTYAGTWWAFSTSPLPGTFDKTTPMNNATGLSLSPTLSWGWSSNTSGYEYCYDTTDNSACDGTWTSTGGYWSSIVLRGLTPNTTYYWQMRSNTNAGSTYANDGTWWSFTTAPLPGNFEKIIPANNATEFPVNPTISWGNSTNATNYQYCTDKTNDDTCNTTWFSSGINNSVSLSGLTPNATYYWQVRADSPSGTSYANAGIWFSFTTAPLPSAFSKTSPASNANNISVNPILSWESSNNVTSYEYCYDTIYNSTCDAIWVSTELNTNVTLSGLNPNTTYYWQIRANGPGGTTNSNHGLWISFKTAPIPGAFNKTSPVNNATNISVNPILSWGNSANATSYEFCYDTTNDNDCLLWVSNGPSTSKALSGLSPSTTYYWHLRAINPGGITYSNEASTAYWSFTTVPPAPQGFNKSAPSNGAVDLPINLTLSWAVSNGVTSYEYCYDTTDDDACSLWTNNGTSTSKSLSGLSNGTTYYWHVRAVNVGGSTEADSGTWWSFKTLPLFVTKTYYSSGSQDGWVLESSETSNAGGMMNSAATTFNLGDDNLKKQYRGILSFTTSSLPDNAVITKITLKVKQQGVTGRGDPVTMFQGFMVDIKKGFFGTAALQTSDFQTTASKTYGPFLTALSGGWYSIDLTPGKGYINKMSTLSGLTQIRLRFKLDDNNNAVANYLSLYSGNAPATSRPQLIIEYYVP